MRSSSLRCAADILRGHEHIYWLIPRKGVSSSADEVLRGIAERVAGRLADPGAGYLRSSPVDLQQWTRTLATDLGALTTTFDVDVIPRAADFAMFSKPAVLLSRNQLREKTLDLLGQLTSNNRLCISTNTGEWLLSYLPQLKAQGRGFRCEIIAEAYRAASARNPFQTVAESRISQLVADLLRAGIKAEVKVAPNKVHQLTAIMDKSGGCSRAIYFRREGKSHTHFASCPGGQG